MKHIWRTSLNICVVCERWVCSFICSVCITIGIIKLIVIRVSMREMCINANTTQCVSEVINKISGSAVLSCWFGPHKRIHLWNSGQKNERTNRVQSSRGYIFLCETNTSGNWMKIIQKVESKQVCEECHQMELQSFCVLFYGRRFFVETLEKKMP